MTCDECSCQIPSASVSSRDRQCQYGRKVKPAQQLKNATISRQRTYLPYAEPMGIICVCRSLPSLHPTTCALSSSKRLRSLPPGNYNQQQNSLELLQDLRQEILETQRDIPIPIIVILLEHIRHSLQRNARLHKQVEAKLALAALVVRLEQQLDKAVRQPVAERNQRVGEFVALDVTGAVRVEAVEQRAPRRQERPQPTEFIEADRARAVAVEHADHHAHRVRVEGRPVAVHERRAEFSFRELAGAWIFCVEGQSSNSYTPPRRRVSPSRINSRERTVLVHCSEQRQERGVLVRARRGRARRGSRHRRRPVVLDWGTWPAYGGRRHGAAVLVAALAVAGVTAVARGVRKRLRVRR